MQCLRKPLLVNVLRYHGLFNPLRHMSVSETSTALRPFYFAVHPDLFGQYPKARAQNEESLKQLNEYMENLRVHQRSRPQSLLFFLRDTTPITVVSTPTKEGHFRLVRISLLSSCPRETVTNVLRSCNLSLDYVNSVQTTPTREGNRPIKWDHTYYSFWGIPNPDEPKRKPRVDDTLSIWFRHKLQTARLKMTTLEPIRRQVEELRQQIMRDLGATDVTWACGWGLAQYRTCLQRILYLYEDYPDILMRLRGHRLVFGQGAGVCIRGDVILCHDDVPQHWLPVFMCLDKHQSILHKIPAAENHLSSLLSGASIVSKEMKNVILAEDYLQQIRRVSKSLQEYTASHPEHKLLHESLEGLRIVQECTPGSLHVSTSGEIYVPSSCPMFLLIDFINKHATEAMLVHAEYKLHNRRVKKLMQKVKQSLNLASLSCDTNVSREQLTSCLRRLLEDVEVNDIDLSGCRIKISHFYSIMSDGEMFIPWNWKGWLDVD